jgi:hypothetical protein
MSQILRLRDPLVPVLCQAAHYHHTRICKRHRSNFRRFLLVLYTSLFYFSSLPTCVSCYLQTSHCNAMCLSSFRFRKYFSNITERFVYIAKNLRKNSINILMTTNILVKMLGNQIFSFSLHFLN